MMSNNNSFYNLSHRYIDYEKNFIYNYDSNLSNTLSVTITSTDKGGYIIQDQSSHVLYTIEHPTVELKPIIDESNISDTSFVSEIEERIEEYIQDNYDRYTIQEHGLYIYETIQEKAYDFIYELIEKAKEDYLINNEEKVVETIMKEIDFDSLYELIENILHAPITMNEKLADIGMSMKDFL